MPQQMYLKLRNLALFGAIGLMLSGCVVHTRGQARYRAEATFRYRPAHVVVDRQPPKVRVANAQPPRPSAGAVWVEGHWSWQDRWVWVDGRWTVPERPNYVWVKPVAETRVDGNYVYHRGYWRAPDQKPAQVYVDTTRRVQVNVTPVKPPSVRASGNVHVSGNASTKSPTAPTTATPTIKAPTTSTAGTIKAPTTATPTIKAPTTSTAGTIKAPTTATPTIKAPTTSTAGTIKAPTTATPTIKAPTTSTATTSVRASTAHAGTATSTPPEGIKCSIKSTRLSTGGYLTLQGQGLTAIKIVQIDGKSVPLFSKRDNMLTAKVSVGITSGVVSLVTNKNKTFSCGRVTVR